MRSTGSRKTLGSRRVRVASVNSLGVRASRILGSLSCSTVLYAEDLRQGGLSNLELLERRLASSEQTLDLVSRTPQQLRERGVRMALGPGEYLDRNSSAAEPDGRLDRGAAQPGAPGRD